MNRTALPSAADSRLGLDTLLRRELKVGDPNDPAQLARALLDRYQDNRRAQAIDSEAKGLPFLQAPIARPVGAQGQAASDFELDLARERVRADLQSLLTDNLTQTMRPELEGWQRAITQAIDEGVANARVGLDPARRDVAFAMRRQLGEYARLSRLVGLFSPSLRPLYRSLASSLDDTANVLLVLTGEAMANLGFSGGRFLLQTSYAELQARRDAVLNALRRIDGVAVLGGETAHWPRGLRAHRQLNLVLEASGQGELRSLLSEGELARVLDELIQLASGGSPMGLRSLGSTAWGPLSRLRRFIRTTSRATEPVAHELAGLLEALNLFIEGFGAAGGFRLLRVARPGLLSHSGGGLPNEEPADRRLVALTAMRGPFAELVDAWTGCACDRDRLISQAALDRVLFDLDRAIDFYANGSGELGLCELRASAMHLLTMALTADSTVVPANANSAALWTKNPLPLWVGLIRKDPVNQRLLSITQLVRPLNSAAATDWALGMADRYDRAFDGNLAVDGEGAPQPRLGQILHDEIASGLDAEQGWLPVVRQLATQSDLINPVFAEGEGITLWQRGVLAAIKVISDVDDNTAMPAAEVPDHFEISLAKMAAD
jgi:hypothetical protein